LARQTVAKQSQRNEANEGARDERAFLFLDKWGDFPFGVIVKSVYF
jgi:hypothetical protein